MTALVNPFMSFPAAAGSVTFVGSARGVSTGATVDVSLPGGSAAADLAIVVAIGGNTATSVPSGFTGVSGANPRVAGLSTAEIRAATKALSGTDISNGYVTCPADPYFNGIEYILFVVRGGSIDVSAAGDDVPFTSPDTVCVIPSVTTTADNALLIGVTGGRTPGTSWGSTPAGWTNDQAQIGSYVSIWAGHRTVDTAGASGSANVTNVGAANKEYLGFALAVKP